MKLHTLFAAAVALFLSTEAAIAVEVKAAVLRIDYPSLLPISRYDLRPSDIGLAGAVLADEDNGTTGSFLGHTYKTTTRAVPPAEADSALEDMLTDGIRLIVIAARKEDLLRLTDRAAQNGALVFNATTPDNDLRSEGCRANLLHVAPSHGMMADTVAQFAVWKKWRNWFLISGSRYRAGRCLPQSRTQVRGQDHRRTFL